ncbi:MAG: hypothetical protein JO183_12055 [Ktedonobacteraceae bacterium]|nr:hypothetical protein [Ktedonobacteraceae bacterium]
MSTRTATRILFWVAFSIFLAVSIPHIAWVFHAFEPQGDGFDGIWWVLAYGFAIAIDVVICWLSYVKSTEEGASDVWITWAFIGSLVIMSWYFNWIYARAHDPSHPGADVWNIQVAPQWGFIGGWSVGTVTPVIISALPVFVIAYTYMLGKVTRMKSTAAKSLAELQAEAAEAEQRAQAERRIRTAYRGPGTMQQGVQLGKGLIDAATELLNELEKKKKDPQSERLEKVLNFFRDAPELLSLENEALADTMIKDMLHLKNVEMARIWRLKVAKMLVQETQDITHNLSSINTNVGQSMIAEKPNGEEAENTAIVEPTWVRDDEVTEQPEDVAQFEPEDFRQAFTHNAEYAAEKDEPDTESLRIFGNMESLSLSKDSSTTPRYITFEQAAYLTGYTVATLKGKVTKGELKRHPTGKNYVLVSSLRRLKGVKRSENMAVSQVWEP